MSGPAVQLSLAIGPVFAEFTPAQAAARVPRKWGRGFWPPHDWLAWPAPSFGIALQQAVELGLVEVRTVVRAEHSRTGERREFYSTDADFPGRRGFTVAGTTPTARRPWIACGSWCEWRRASARERAA